MRQSTLLPCFRLLERPIFTGAAGQLAKAVLYGLLQTKLDHAHRLFADLDPAQHTKAAKIALSLGPLGNDLFDDICGVLKRSNTELSETLTLALRALQTHHHPNISLALPDVRSLLCYKQHSFAPADIEVGQETIKTVLQIGVKIIRNDQVPMFNLLEQAVLELVLLFNQGAPDNRREAMRAYEKLTMLSIINHRDPLKIGLVSNLSEVEEVHPKLQGECALSS